MVLWRNALQNFLAAFYAFCRSSLCSLTSRGLFLLRHLTLLLTCHINPSITAISSRRQLFQRFCLHISSNNGVDRTFQLSWRISLLVIKLCHYLLYYSKCTPNLMICGPTRLLVYDALRATSNWSCKEGSKFRSKKTVHLVFYERYMARRYAVRSWWDVISIWRHRCSWRCQCLHWLEITCLSKPHSAGCTKAITTFPINVFVMVDHSYLSSIVKFEIHETLYMRQGSAT